MGSGNLNLVAEGMQLPDIIKKQQVLVIKLKKEWRKGSGRGERRKTWGSRQKKERMVKMEVWEKSMRICWRYTRNRSRFRGVRKRTEQTRFRWQWSECFREDERDRKILNKGFKNETLQKKNLESKNY
jgi:hypothetical protein